MKRQSLTKVTTIRIAALTGAALLMGTTLASAQGTKPQSSINVTNARSAMLTVFEIATTGDNPKLVARITKPLAPGKSVKLALKGAKGCAYYVLARFDDDSEATSDSMDLCQEKVVRLTE